MLIVAEHQHLVRIQKADVKESSAADPNLVHKQSEPGNINLIFQLALEPFKGPLSLKNENAPPVFGNANEYPEIVVFKDCGNYRAVLEEAALVLGLESVRG